MADVDTSTYPKPPLPVSPFDIANSYGGLAQRAQSLQSGQLTIQRQQLENANVALTHVASAIDSLGNNPTKDQITKILQNTVDMGLAPQSMMDNVETQIPNDPKFMPEFINRWRTQTASHQEMINYFLGQNGFVQNGQQVIPIRTPEMGTGPVQTGAPIQMQLPPTTPTVNTQPGPGHGQQGYLGPTGAQNPLPIAPSPAAIQPPMGTVSPSVSPPASPMGPTLKDQGRVPQGGPIPGQSGFTPSAMPPLYETGVKQYTTDQANANSRLSAIKPALLALQDMKGLTTGPGTVEFNKWAAILKNYGIIPTKENDPVALREATNKYLAQYLGQTPFRSDAEQLMRQSGSPNADVQINQALTNLTKSSIMLDRLRALQSLSFTNPDGTPRTDFENYQQYAAKFPNDVDHTAVGLDLMDPKDRKALIAKMDKQRNTPDGQKFFNTLDLAKKAGLYQ